MYRPNDRDASELRRGGACFADPARPPGPCAGGTPPATPPPASRRVLFSSSCAATGSMHGRHRARITAQLVLVRLVGLSDFLSRTRSYLRTVRRRDDGWPDPASVDRRSWPHTAPLR